jgi:hypothetical protein
MLVHVEHALHGRHREPPFAAVFLMFDKRP